MASHRTAAAASAALPPPLQCRVYVAEYIPLSPSLYRQWQMSFLGWVSGLYIPSQTSLEMFPPVF